MQSDAVEILSCRRYINDDEAAVQHYHLELTSIGSTRRRSRVWSVDTWDLSTEEAEALLALAKTTDCFDRYGLCRSMRPAPAAAAPPPIPQPLATAAAAAEAVLATAPAEAPPAPTPAATRLRFDPNETDDSNDEEEDAEEMVLEAVAVPLAVPMAVEAQGEVEEDDVEDDVEDEEEVEEETKEVTTEVEAAETQMVLYEAPTPPARLVTFVPKPPLRCTRDGRCTNVYRHRGQCSIPKALKPPKPPKQPKPPKPSTKPPTKSIGKLPFKCNTLRKTKVVPEVVLGQPVAEQTVPPMSATTTTTVTTTYQFKLKEPEASEPLMPPKKRGATAPWRVQTEVKIEVPESEPPKSVELLKSVEPRTPELPPQHELTPSLRDLPPLEEKGFSTPTFSALPIKLDPNPKARPWTTKRQLTPTPEEVDAVEVAKAKAHTRLVMGYAPPNVEIGRWV